MRAHEGMADGRQGGAFGIVIVRVAKQPTRMKDRVFAHQPFDHLLHVVGEVVVGGAQVGEFRLAALGRDDMGIEHGILAGDRAERGIRVPELDGQGVEAAVVGPVAYVALLVEVRDIGDLAMGEAADDAMVARRRDRTEAAAEHQERVVVERLAGEDENAVFVHRLPDRLDHGVVEVGRQRHALHLANEQGVQLPYFHGHGRLLLKTP